MQANRSRDTGPEVAVRRLLFAHGLRYRVAYHPLPNNHRMTVDIAFPGARIVVLIDGCFWHGCPEHYRQPRVHSDYWQAKIAGNTARDERTNSALADAGWTVYRFWTHEQPDAIAATVEQAVREAMPRRQLDDGSIAAQLDPESRSSPAIVGGVV